MDHSSASLRHTCLTAPDTKRRSAPALGAGALEGSSHGVFRPVPHLLHLHRLGHLRQLPAGVLSACHRLPHQRPLAHKMHGRACRLGLACLMHFSKAAVGTVPAVMRIAHPVPVLPQSWLGFQPMVLVMTGVAAASTYVSMPNNPKEDSAILQIWLQARMHACTGSLPCSPAS